MPLILISLLSHISDISGSLLYYTSVEFQPPSESSYTQNSDLCHHVTYTHILESFRFQIVKLASLYWPYTLLPRTAQ
ncbi:hypothetical protein F383_28388 [Gossypium arboreum]|uniref:Uncharacterized protein n=1 Tax=Gossypium arboreum TaxID=29729 RepID=A0A0B0MWD2_GOSAR|nr:hypothetical protein F383_28388 [Gossypium arboreum]